MSKVRTILTAGILAGSAALAGCATVEEAVVESTAKTYSTTLLGSNEPDGGDPDGYGTAQVSISDRLNQVCYELKDIRGIGPITAAHIHAGAAGVNGPPVITLTMANEGGYKGCTGRSGEFTEDNISRNFANFYVNVHTAEFPNGAIRGQLRD